MRQYAIGIATVLTLGGCGSYHSTILYEPSTTTRAATFVPGDSCSAPYYRFGSIAGTQKALVFLNARNIEDRPVLDLSVTITGVSRFRFLDDSMAFYNTNDPVGTGMSVKMTAFQSTTGMGQFPERDFRPSEELVGPPRASFRPHYPENSYEKTQWIFTTKIIVPSSNAAVFSARIPDAVIDGETLSFPLVSFRRRETNYRILCLK